MTHTKGQQEEQMETYEEYTDRKQVEMATEVTNLKSINAKLLEALEKIVELEDLKRRLLDE